MSDARDDLAAEVEAVIVEWFMQPWTSEDKPQPLRPYVDRILAVLAVLPPNGYEQVGCPTCRCRNKVHQPREVTPPAEPPEPNTGITPEWRRNLGNQP